MIGVIDLHVLVTGVQTDRLALLADAVDLVALALYLTGVRRLAGRGRRWPLSATAAFCTGMACIWIATGSGLAAYDDSSASVHVVQHALLMMVAPPLIALGRPVTLAIQAAHRSSQVRLVKVVHSRTVASLTYPVTGWFLYYGTMYACLLDRQVYRYLLQHPLVHDTSHLILLVIGYLYWQPLIGGDPTRWRLSQRACVISTTGGAASELILGAALLTSHGPLDPSAGAVLLASAFVTCSMCGAVIARRPLRMPRLPALDTRSMGPVRALGDQ